MNKIYISICITGITGMFSVAEADTADIGGLVYYYHDIDEGSPVNGAEVTLYSRNT